MKKIMMTTSIVALLAMAPQAFANTNAGATLWIGVTVADDTSIPAVFPNPMDIDDYEDAGVFWTQIKGVGNFGESGSTTNILNYDTWDDDTIQKSEGLTNAGDPEIELARIPTDPGQIALRAAALVKNRNYIFKVVRNDAPVGGTPTVIYNRGLVTGPRRPNGRNEDFDLEMFTLGLQQREVVSDAAA